MPMAPYTYACEAPLTLMLVKPPENLRNPSETPKPAEIFLKCFETALKSLWNTSESL